MVLRGVVVAGIVAGVVAGCGGSSGGGGGAISWDAGAPDSGSPVGVTTPEAGPPVCGDSACNGAETCATCALDCGQCPACLLAPSCSDALGVPANPTSRPDLDIGEDVDAGPDSGIPTALPGQDGCQDAQLRLRIAQITTYSGGSQIYCVISSSDGQSSEAALTTKTKSLGSGESYFFDPTSSVFWGQTALHPTTDNLTITYNCFEVVDNSAWAAALNALSGAAQSAGGVAGPYGWAFGVGSAAAAAAAAAVNAASGDKLVFNEQQTISRAELIDLTNGRTWNVRQGGGSLFSKWDWELTIESWGCADGVIPAK